MAIPEGQILAAKYRIEKLLGQGGMGAVYVATNTVLQRKVALKVMNERFAAVPAAVERFLREAVAASRVSHPSIVQVFDAGEHAGKPWIAMELLDGESLGERLERGPMSVDDVLRMAEGVLSALAEVHAEGIVHRDLKPDNIFLARTRSGDWLPKVLDFGVAKDTSDGALSKLTATGAVVGTAHYLSPEQAKGLADIDARADVYAVGVVLFEALSGRMPYEAETITQLIAKMFTEQPRRLDEVAPHVPPPIADVVTTCLEQDRNRRFQTARALLGALTAAAEAIGSRSAPGLAATAQALTPVPLAATAAGHLGGPHGRIVSAPGSMPAPHAAMSGSHGSTPSASQGFGAFGSAAVTPPPPSSPAPFSADPSTGGPAFAGSHSAPARAPQTVAAPFGAGPFGAAPVAPPAGRERRSRAWTAAALGLLFTLGAAAMAGGWYFVRRGDRSTREVAAAPSRSELRPSTPATAPAPSEATQTARVIDLAAESPLPTEPPRDPVAPERSAGDALANRRENSERPTERDDDPARRRREEAQADRGPATRVDPGSAADAADRAEPNAPARTEPDEPSEANEPSDAARSEPSRGDDRASARTEPARSAPRIGLANTVVLNVVQSRMPFITERCYQRRARRVRGLAGVITVAWTVRPDGGVDDPRIVHNGTGDEWLARCTRNAIADLRFPRAGNGLPTPARFPFQFRAL